MPTDSVADCLPSRLPAEGADVGKLVLRTFPSNIISKRGRDPLSNHVCRFPEIIKADGTIAGYISSEFDSQHAYTLTTSKSSALQVNLPSTSPFGASFNILAVNGQDNRHPYLGAVGGGNGYRFGQGQRGSAFLTGTGASPANSPPSSRGGTSMQSTGYNAPGESQIWSMDCKTREISAQWTNADSTQPETTIFYDTVDKYLGLTSDLEAFNVGPQDAHSVTFYFVPLINASRTQF
ncbi:hypothetical protein MSAN_00401600 [Mycena sanguinolenta]|uniref:Uncharacterized protein n=1 Tax=Mycena sanguinolenta TaxID=230812 RepID=A0A8H6ZE03_9AGAR|nr:hypothetical protein MSAN_00401600 [Mycena sanguinolenta]